MVSENRLGKARTAIHRSYVSDSEGTRLAPYWTETFSNGDTRRLNHPPVFTPGFGWVADERDKPMTTEQEIHEYYKQKEREMLEQWRRDARKQTCKDWLIYIVFLAIALPLDVLFSRWLFG